MGVLGQGVGSGAGTGLLGRFAMLAGIVGNGGGLVLGQAVVRNAASRGTLRRTLGCLVPPHCVRALMPSRIEDYAVIGNCETLALIGRDGSIDWLCLPRFDSGACFSALLGESRHGRWLIAPEASDVRISRRYRSDTLILETVFRTEHGAVSLTDFMSRRDGACDLVRIVRGLEGEVAMRMELVVRYDYGSVVPWVSNRRTGGSSSSRAPTVSCSIRWLPTRGEGFRTLSDFTIRAGQEASFALNWSPSFRPAPPPLPAAQTLEEVESSWSGWAARSNPCEHRNDAVLRSLLTLKALTHWETGGIVAAGTTSLPEKIGGSRNWDYRYCWLRDATFTLLALIGAGFLDEAKAWHQWLLRAVAGSPDDVQTMYGLAGERRLVEYEIAWLPGYEGGPRPRRQRRRRTAAARRLRRSARRLLRRAPRRSVTSAETWDLECALLVHLETIWREPDEGIWEVRGGPETFHPFEGDGLGRLRSRRAIDRGIRSRRSARTLAIHSVRDLRGGVRARIRSGAKYFRPIFRRERRSTPVFCLFPLSASCRPTTLGFAARSQRSSMPSCATDW